jgi:hypothetical protein
MLSNGSLKADPPAFPATPSVFCYTAISNNLNAG